MTVFLDRSNVNGVDDYKRSGTTHLYLKVSEGTGFVDSTYQSRRLQAHNAGALVGGYHFAAQNDPVAEADFFLSHLADPLPGDLRPCLDLEAGQSAAWAEAFVRRLRKRLGYWPVLYGSTSFIAPLRSSNATLKRCPWWRAEYGPNDGQRHPLTGGDQGAAAHQYTSVAHVPGISGATDRSALIVEKSLLVPKPVIAKPYAIFKNGTHVKNTRTRRGATMWVNLHRQPRRNSGDSVQIRNRKP